MSFMKKSAAALVLTGVAAATSTALAAGFQLTEQSSLGAGRAYAGAGIVGDDLSAVHYNPAGMTLLEGTRFQAGGVWIGLNADYSSDISGESENGRLKGQMIPAGYVTHQVNDKIWLGFAMTVPFGMGTEYSKDWEGADRGTNAKIYTFDMNPSIAWKVNDFLSIGGGISVQYAKAELGMGMSGLGHGKVEADSWDWGFNLGVMISPTDKLRFGLAYRSSIEHDAEGDLQQYDELREKVFYYTSETKPLRCKLVKNGNKSIAIGGIKDPAARIVLSVNMKQPGEVSFWYANYSFSSVSGQLRFSIDDEEKISVGNVEWSFKSFPLSAGIHTLCWVGGYEYGTNTYYSSLDDIRIVYTN